MEWIERRFWTWLFLAFIAWPLVLGVLGVAGPSIENRALTAAPPMTLSRLLDPTWYEQLSGFLQDHLPLRGTLVRANSRLTVRVWSYSPNPDVHVGLGDWLFTTSYKDLACPDQMPLGVVDRLEELGRQLAQSGRDMRLVLAPNKATVYPEFLGAAAPAEFACGITRFAALRREVSRRPAVGFVDIWGHLSALKASAHEPLYFAEDSHWTLRSAAELSHVLVDSVAPGLWRDADVVVTRQIQLPMDLALMIGDSSAVPVSLLETRRAGVTTQIAETQDCERGPACIVRYRSSTSGAPLIDQRTLFVRDSFGTMSMATLAPYFADITFLFWSDDVKAQLAARLGETDLVIYETFDQFLFERVAGGFTDIPVPPLTGHRRAGERRPRRTRRRRSGRCG